MRGAGCHRPVAQSRRRQHRRGGSDESGLRNRRHGRRKRDGPFPHQRSACSWPRRTARASGANGTDWRDGSSRTARQSRRDGITGAARQSGRNWIARTAGQSGCDRSNRPARTARTNRRNWRVGIRACRHGQMERLYFVTPNGLAAFGTAYQNSGTAADPRQRCFRAHYVPDLLCGSRTKQPADFAGWLGSVPPRRTAYRGARILMSRRATSIVFRTPAGRHNGSH